MNALTRIPPLPLLAEPAPLVLRPRPSVDPAVFGVVAAMVLWALLHAALVLSWLTAGRL
ncbi:MAG: hypothetical protein Q8L48_11045 [Archangium sp.]|nr:hypothetical protein [Archangium sp.]